MVENTTTRNEVIETLNEALNTVEAESSDLAGGVRAVVPEEEVGRAFGIIRRSGYEFESRRDPSSENVMFNIAAKTVDTSEEEDNDSNEGLGELFSG